MDLQEQYFDGWNGQLLRNEGRATRPSRACPGRCPLLNTAIDSDDGNPRLREKARWALDTWLRRLEFIIQEGRRRGEIRGDVDSSELAGLIVATLEGSLMMSRLGRKQGPRDLAYRHLEEHLETKFRAKELKGKSKRS